MSSAQPTAEAPGRMSTVLFTTVVFASAFLIFLVQPMVGKRILPWFGGAPTVWTLCLAFYQSTLFIGYAYADISIRFASPRVQLAIHSILFLACVALLPVLPSDDWKPVGAADPTLSIATLLVVNVALPFMLLASTGPLAQAWFVRRQPRRSPYPLYAVSNAGSLAALIGYPFALEPHLSLSATGDLWSIGFAITGIAVLACAWSASRVDSLRPDVAEPKDEIHGIDVALWVLLPGCAVLLLMGITNELCLDLASVPFLWILPLSVYLATFILCFGSTRIYRRAIWVGLSIAPIAVSFLIGRFDPEGSSSVLTQTIQYQVFMHSWILFGVCMVLHGEVHRLRPGPHHLTAFYLCLSGGGALGGLFVALIAPIVFDDYHELQLGLSLALVLVLVACRRDTVGWLHRGVPNWRWPLVLAASATLIFDWTVQSARRSDNVLLQRRSFFGVLRVVESGSGKANVRRLLNGTTVHGTQFREWQGRPASYYGLLSGIGLVLVHRAPAQDSRIGIIGLGIGTLAAYLRPGDRFRFYEIDPAVVRISRDEDYFSYLSRGQRDIEIVEGDARIALTRELALETSPPFDILVVDAFSSDAIPVHLLTREALDLYMRAIGDDGLLMIHASSQHLNLAGLIARLGDDAGLQVAAIENDRMPRQLTREALWMALSRDPERIREIEQVVRERARRLDAASLRTYRLSGREIRDLPVWTDDYSDLFSALKPLAIRIGNR